MYIRLSDISLLILGFFQTNKQTNKKNRSPCLFFTDLFSTLKKLEVKREPPKKQLWASVHPEKFKNTTIWDLFEENSGRDRSQMFYAHRKNQCRPIQIAAVSRAFSKCSIFVTN